jgi:hypothetical protein
MLVIFVCAPNKIFGFTQEFNTVYQCTPFWVGACSEISCELVKNKENIPVYMTNYLEALSPKWHQELCRDDHLFLILVQVS